MGRRRTNNGTYQDYAEELVRWHHNSMDLYAGWAYELPYNVNLFRRNAHRRENANTDWTLRVQAWCWRHCEWHWRMMFRDKIFRTNLVR